MANRKLTDYIPVNGCKRITTYMAGVIRENWRGCVLFLLMCVNLLYMHNVVLTDDMQDTDRYIRKPFAFACFDVLLTLLFFSLLTWRRKKLTYILSYAFLVFLCCLMSYTHGSFIHISRPVSFQKYPISRGHGGSVMCKTLLSGQICYLYSLQHCLPCALEIRCGVWHA